MNGDEILGVLKQIRDEAKKTNVQLEQTNTRLESLEGRVEQTNTRLESIEGRVDETNTRLESLEGRVEQTNTRLESLEGRVDQTNTRLESLEGRTEFLERRLTKGFESVVEELESVARRQGESEMRLATEVISLADVTRDVRDLFGRKLDDHVLVLDLQKRVSALEEQTEK